MCRFLESFARVACDYALDYSPLSEAKKAELFAEWETHIPSLVANYANLFVQGTRQISRLEFVLKAGTSDLSGVFSFGGLMEKLN